MLDAISFALMIVSPNLALMGLGFYLQKMGKINTYFIDTASNIVFNFALPCLLFFSVIKNNVDYDEQLALIMAGVVTTFVLFLGQKRMPKYSSSRRVIRAYLCRGCFALTWRLSRCQWQPMLMGWQEQAWGRCMWGSSPFYVMFWRSSLYHARAVLKDCRFKVGTFSSRLLKIHSSLHWCLPLFIKHLVCPYHLHRLLKQVS